MKWWESYGMVVATLIALGIALFTSAVKHNLLPASMWDLSEFLQDAQNLVLAAMINLGIRVAISPTNSTTKGS